MPLSVEHVVRRHDVVAAKSAGELICQLSRIPLTDVKHLEPERPIIDGGWPVEFCIVEGAQDQVEVTRLTDELPVLVQKVDLCPRLIPPCPELEAPLHAHLVTICPKPLDLGGERFAVVSHHHQGSFPVEDLVVIVLASSGGRP
jgi:hypothetical protein